MAAPSTFSSHDRRTRCSSSKTRVSHEIASTFTVITVVTFKAIAKGDIYGPETRLRTIGNHNV